MAGQMTVLDVEFTDTTLPKIRVDPILSSGSLLLIDFSHSQGKISAVPTNDGVIPNVARAESSAILGVAVDAVRPTFLTSAQAADAKFELTSKGALYGIYSQVNNTATGRGAYVSLPDSISAYLIANKTHKFYVSSWVRRTRAALTSPQNGASMRWIDLGYGGSFLAQASGSNASFKVSENSKLDGGGFNTVSNRYLSMSGNAGAGDAVTSPRGVMVWGGKLTADTFVNVAASDILYRTYIEDLTVSGRTYAQVEAIDKALWDVAFAVGGRYYGDTFTAPSAFP